MGIPYYFASLVREHKGILSRVGGLLTPDILAIDFNCFIHTYLDDTNPLESIVVALRDLLTNTCKATKHVYIAMDGLVPYGKIVQQRYRRFRIPEKTPVFDRHQISPGTPYMKELADAIRAAFPTAILSDTTEPGEGEHKLLAWIKTLPTTQRRSITVYGLDADLILLCLIQKELSNPYGFNLLRENISFNNEKPGFSTLSMWKLADKIEVPLLQYIWLSVLCFGNDFMPALAMFSLREGGHERAMSVYKEAGEPDLTTQSGRSIFMKTAARHELRILKEKVHKRGKPAERAIVAMDGEKLRERYNLHVLDGVRDVKPVVDAYWKTAYWTMHYFTMNETPCWNWVYPYADAPLVCQIVDNLPPADEKPFTPGPPPFTVTHQLQFILPSASLRTCKKRVLFPDEFYHEETDTRMPWMKRYVWESRPRISLPWAPVSETQTKIEAWNW
jgi:5'-3' exonuclease